MSIAVSSLAEETEYVGLTSVNMFGIIRIYWGFGTFSEGENLNPGIFHKVPV